VCSGDENGVNSASTYPSFLFLLYHLSVRFSPSSQWKVAGLASCRAHQLIQADIKCNLSEVDEPWGHCWIFDAETRLTPSIGIVSSNSTALTHLQEEKENATHNQTDSATSSD